VANLNALAFQDVVDIVESLPEEQQATLIDIIRHRLIARRRQIIANNIRQARQEYDRGDLKTGNVDELMKELSK